MTTPQSSIQSLISPPTRAPSTSKTRMRAWMSKVPQKTTRMRILKSLNIVEAATIKLPSTNNSCIVVVHLEVTKKNLVNYKLCSHRQSSNNYWLSTNRAAANLMMTRLMSRHSLWVISAMMTISIPMRTHRRWFHSDSLLFSMRMSFPSKWVKITPQRPLCINHHSNRRRS